MPYFKYKTEEWLDSKGNKVLPGDVLQNVNPDDIHKFFVCFSWDEDIAFIRDLISNNVGMCGPSEVVNIGHFTQCLDKLEGEDLGYYFGIPNNQVIMKINRVRMILEEIVK